MSSSDRGEALAPATAQALACTVPFPFAMPHARLAREVADVLERASVELREGIRRISDLGDPVGSWVAIVSDAGQGFPGMARFMTREQALAWDDELPEVLATALACPRPREMPVLVVLRDHDEVALAWARVLG